MLSPSYLERAPDALVELFSEVERDILADMARRIARYDYFIPAAAHQLRTLEEMGHSQDYVLSCLAKRLGSTEEALLSLLHAAAQTAVRADAGVYRRAGLEPPEIKDSERLRTVLAAGLQQTGQTFQNLTRSTARGAYEQFGRALDRAWMQVSSGAFDTNTAIRSAVKWLSAQGVQAVDYDSGRTNTLEAAVRRAVVTGLNQTTLKVQEVLADEMDCDLVEVTAHSGARPDHAKWQGKIFSRSGTSKKYPDFRRETGYGTGAGLGGWNCRHSFYPYFEGSPRTYTAKELKKLEARDYTYNGQKLTEYEATQTQRGIERNIRRWKREQAAMRAAGLPDDEAAAKVKEWQARQRDFVAQTGLKRQYDRERIAGPDARARKRAQQKQEQAALEKERQRAYNQEKERARARILAEGTPKKLNVGNQNKHIRTSKGYLPGRSYLYGSLEEAQALVDRYHGTGEVKLSAAIQWTHKEFVVADHPIGVWVDQTTGEERETRRFSIHYGKKGTHVVPAKEVSES